MFSITTILLCVLLSTWLNFTQGQETCGGVLTTTEGRQHMNHMADKHLGQRCSWILNAPQATDYEILLTSIDQGTVTIMAFSDGTQKKQTILEFNKSYVIHGSVLVITFAGDPSFASKSGFELIYSPITSQNPDDTFISPHVGSVTRSPHNLESGSAGSSNSHLLIFVQSPLSRDRSFQFYSLELSLVQLVANSRCCSDRVTVWTFDASVARWRLHARYCGHAEEPAIATYINRDVFMIVYERETALTSQGISFSFGDSLGERRPFYTRHSHFIEPTESHNSTTEEYLSSSPQPNDKIK